MENPKTIRRIERFLLLGLSFAVFSCASNQIKESRTDNSKKSVLAWRGKALIFDKIKDSKNTVSLEVISSRPKNMRMDVTTTLGFYIGSFVWNESQMQILLARDKKYITGPANADSMQEILKMQIDPLALFNIFWEEHLANREWSCEFDHVGLSKICKHKALMVQVIWQERSGRHRLIEIDSPKVNTQLSLTEGDEKVELKSTSFQLKAPEGFRNIKL